MTSSSSSRTDWLLFALLGFLWGSSYLFIKIGVDAGLRPFTLVALRLLIGCGLLAVVVWSAREQLPRSRVVYGHLFVMGCINVALPFVLITWAERSVPSSLAAVLNGAVPLFVIPIAAIFLHDERITLNRVMGLVIGFVGVAILVGFDPADLAGSSLTAELALIGSTISYACGAVYARRYVHGLRPMIPALFQVFFALLIAGALVLAFERPLSFPADPSAVLAVVWLGLLGRGRRTSSSSACCTTGERPEPRWSPICCRCTASCSVPSCSARRWTRDWSSARPWSSAAWRSSTSDSEGPRRPAEGYAAGFQGWCEVMASRHFPSSRT